MKHHAKSSSDDDGLIVVQSKVSNNLQSQSVLSTGHQRLRMPQESSSKDILLRGGVVGANDAGR